MKEFKFDTLKVNFDQSKGLLKFNLDITGFENLLCLSYKLPAFFNLLY